MRSMGSKPIEELVLAVTLSFALPSLGNATCNFDSVVDAGEECDLGPGNGGDTCCTALCTFRSAGATCGPSVDACDLPETCTGWSDVCPADGFVPGAKQCKPSITFPAPDFSQPISSDVAYALETNVSLIERSSHGTFNLQKRAVKLPKYRNYDIDGVSLVPGWVVVLITNGALSSAVEVQWKVSSLKSAYPAGPGEQIIVAAPLLDGKKSPKFKIKGSGPASGTVDFLTLTPAPLRFVATDTPRPLLINRSTKKPLDVAYTLANGGSAAIWVYTCPTADYVPSNCSTVQVLPAGMSGPPLDLSVGSGQSIWYGAEPGFSSVIDVSFSERDAIGYAVRS